MRFSACIELLFTEFPFLERISKAKDHNFDAIEFWNWKDKKVRDIKDECDKKNIKIAIFVGNTKGQMVDPRDNKVFINGVKESIDVAKNLDCKNLILTTNILQEDRSVAPLTEEISNLEKRENILKTLSKLDNIAKNSDIILNIEPLNTIIDHKGYFLTNSYDGFDMLRVINSRNIKLLYDIYHMQIMEGNIIENLINNIDLIGHIHIADVPGRHEPGTGEINFNNIFKVLNKVNFEGYIGFEFIPSSVTDLSLKIVKEIFKF